MICIRTERFLGDTDITYNVYNEECASVCVSVLYTFSTPPHLHISTKFGMMVEDLPGKVSDTS